MNNKTLYKRLDEICERETILNQLPKDKYKTFVDLLYIDISSWDEPMNVSEVDVIHRIGEHLTRMVSSMLVYPNIGTTHD
jgi:hypothetical protein|tara:strand:- start:248 stop:487 length:240 start_codon:yes stop_codon:yes gene_type:complete